MDNKTKILVISILDKLAHGEDVDNQVYYVGGSLCIDLPEDTYPSFAIVNIGEVKQDLGAYAEYCACKIYLCHKSESAHFYERAKTVVNDWGG